MLCSSMPAAGMVTNNPPIKKTMVAGSTAMPRVALRASSQSRRPSGGVIRRSAVKMCSLFLRSQR